MKIPNIETFSNIRKLYRIFNKRQKKSFWWLVFCTFFGSVTDLVGLSFIIPIIGLVLSDNFYRAVATWAPFLQNVERNKLLLLAVAVFFIVILLKNGIGLLINRVQINFVKDLYITSTTSVLKRIYNKSYIELQKTPSAKLANKLSGMLIGLANNATLSVITIINELMIFTITSIVLVSWNWQLFALTLAVIIPVMGVFYSRVKNTIKTAGIERNALMARLIGQTQEMIFGYADIKIAGTEDSYKQQYHNIVSTFSEHQKKLNFINFLPTRILEIAVFLCIIFILVYCVFVLEDTASIVTTISLFSVVAYRSIPSVNRLVMAMTQLNAHQYVLEDPDIQPDTEDAASQTGTPVTFRESIRFRDVSYRYPAGHTDVLDNCNLEIRRGEKIGIIGQSGAGKSTIINHILGFLYPTKGQILIDDIPLTKNNIESWWKILGYVRQDVFILNSTLKENIILREAEEKTDPAKLERAIKLASLEELVASWPDGIHTVLGERGNNLSGGQKQRIAIARAIYKGADVLIFDEATSSLDSRTEEEITNAIRELGKENLTIIIIAHRYTSLKYCDKIYRLEKGSITEKITYDDLALEING